MQLIEAPSVITATGTPPKSIAEYVSRRTTGGSALSVAHMISPRGWQEPGQTPEFDEYTVVMRGTARRDTNAGDGGSRGTSYSCAEGRVGPVFDARRRWGGVCRGLSACVFAADSASGRVKRTMGAAVRCLHNLDRPSTSHTLSSPDPTQVASLS
jgi:hypothetical protein